MAQRPPKPMIALVLVAATGGAILSLAVLPPADAARPGGQRPQGAVAHAPRTLPATPDSSFSNGEKRRLAGSARGAARAAKAGRKCPKAGRKLPKRAGRRCAKRAKETKKVKPQRATGEYTPLPAPDETHEQGEPEVTTPRGRLRPLEDPGQPAAVSPNPRAQAAGVSSSPAFARGAPADPLAFFRVSDIGTPPGPPNLGPHEPTTAVGGGVVWFTGNWSVAYSLDGGRTFTTLDPSTVLPDAGLPFCCDQVVGYSTRENLFVWLLQYSCSPGSSAPPTNDCTVPGTGSNRLRIAVASPEEIRANTAAPGRAWTYWDLPPSLFRQPSGAWFDYNDLAVNRSSVTFTTNAQRPGRGSLMARISLADLAGRRSIRIQYAFADPVGNMKAVQGEVHHKTYFVGNETLGRVLIYSWAPRSDTLFLHRVNHTTVPKDGGPADWALGGCAPCPPNIVGTDGNSWYGRYLIFPGQLAGATFQGGELWLAWGTGRAYCTSGCGPGGTPVLNQVLPHPSIQLGVIEGGRWRLERERWLWNPDLAFGYPALATSRGGDVGVTFLYSPVPGDPLPVAGFLTGGEEFVAALPTTLPLVAGDYYSLRPGSSPSSFVTGAYTNQADPGGNAFHWHYIEYGRGEPSHAPTASIASPPDNSQFLVEPQPDPANGQDYKDVQFIASASDPDGDPLTYRWTDSVNGGPAVEVSSELSPLLRLYLPPGSPGFSATHDLTLTVSDGTHETAVSIRVRVYTLV